MMQTFPLMMKAGIQRDGTRFTSQYYTDGKWCRFQRGLPRKMGGYKQIVQLEGTPRGIFVVPTGIDFRVYAGTSEKLFTFLMDKSGNATSQVSDVTPEGFAADDNNLWQFDAIYDANNNVTGILAHAAPNGGSISNVVKTPIYLGDVNSTRSFAADIKLNNESLQVSGGITMLYPYLFAYGNNGEIRWSKAGNPREFPEENVANPSALKIVKGGAVRGGGSSPSGLFWSLNSVIRVSFEPSVTNFRFDTLASQSSILSSQSVIEYDGLYFWAASDRFMMYNGAIQEVPNNMNLNYFFFNLNYAHKQKVWATKVPQFGEIWWHFPTGDSSECDRAVIFNIRENTWYDTEIRRSCGYFEQVFSDPLWLEKTGGAIDQEATVWHQESGVDQVYNRENTAIPSYFETGDITWCGKGPLGEWTGVERIVDLQRLEPDFIQRGDLTLEVKGRKFARSAEEVSNPYKVTPQTEKIDMREQAREMRLRFTSDSVDGFYELGNSILHFRQGDVRP